LADLIQTGRRRFTCSIGASVVASAALLSFPARGKHLRIVASGTGSAVGCMRLVADQIARAAAHLVVEVMPAVGSRGALRALADGRLDVALSNFAPLPQHVNQVPVVAFEYARTPFVIAVRRGTGLATLDSAELPGLFVPGARFPSGARARPVLRPSDDVDNELLGRFSPGVAEALARASRQPGMLTAGTDSDAADLIEKTEGAFGATTLGQIISERRPLDALVIDGKEPSVDNLRTGQYPHYKRLFAVVRSPVTEPVALFQTFLLGPAGRGTLINCGQLPV
jgi:phosphate transport system substrate-binding protein